jgi:hypothetical protein
MRDIEMTAAVSFTQPTAQTFYRPCGWVSDICRTIYDLAMKIFKAIHSLFSAKEGAAPSGMTSNSTPIPTTTTTTMIPAPRNLIPFYRGLEANNNHVTLDQILSWDDGQLESVHHFIQWLFPLETSSGPNPTAPVLDSATMQVFSNDGLLKNQVLRSFRRMLTFYGLQIDEATLVITRASNFNARAAIWLTPANHNFLRITRIIQSLGLLGLPDHGRSFFIIMQDIARNEGSGMVDNVTLGYWCGAFRQIGIH